MEVRNTKPCKSCGAPIFFARNVTTGRPQPFDAEPTGAAWVVKWIADPTDTAYGGHYLSSHRPTFMPHHATCPHADQHRRSR